MLYLPSHDGFWEFLHQQTPPGWKEGLSQSRVIFAPDANGILQLINEEDLEDYWEEHEERDRFWENDLESEDDSLLWLPC